MTINGTDIKAGWGLEPMIDTYYNSIMKYPSVKDRIVEDWEDEHGVDVLLSDAKVSNIESTISFICDNITQYNAFVQYLVAQKKVQLRDAEVGKVINLEYLSCSSFNNYNIFCTFGVRFREANFRTRTGLQTFGITFDNTFD